MSKNGRRSFIQCLNFKPRKLLRCPVEQLPITFPRLAKVAIFTTNVHAENKTFGYHKCVSGALNRQFFVG
jgi:hypothetical protein